MQQLSERSLRRKEDESIYIIREAVACSTRPALLWSLGKDSTAMLHLARQAYLGHLPFPVIHLDTGQKFPQMYAFRDRWARQWKLDLIVARNDQAMSEGVTCCMDTQMTCCHRLKTEVLRQVVQTHRFDALFVGIRRDEHGVRAKERYFSPRNTSFNWNYKQQPVEVPGITPALAAAAARPATRQGVQRLHFRVHPMLHWSEIDIWSYTRLAQLPVVELYFARNGHRYRSLGCQPSTQSVESDATDIDAIIAELCHTHHGERAGRAQDKETVYRMERLRSLGYM